MVEKEISDIFLEIISNNLRYCSMCLRNENERKLVDPVFYKRCLILLPLLSMENDTEWVCYICEAQAMRALHVFEALSLAVTLRQWFRAVAKRLRPTDRLPEDLQQVTQTMKFGDQSLAEFWWKHRARSELLQTEILSIHTTGVEQPGDVDTIEMITETPSPPLTYVEGPDPDQPPDMTGDPDLENVVILDDEDTLVPPEAPPLTVSVPHALPNLVPLAHLLCDPDPRNVAVLPSKHKVLVGRSGASTDSFVLHPGYVLENDNWYIPSLGSIMSDQGLELAPNLNIVVDQPLPEIDLNYLEIDGKKYSVEIVQPAHFDSCNNYHNYGGQTDDILVDNSSFYSETDHNSFPSNMLTLQPISTVAEETLANSVTKEIGTNQSTDLKVCGPISAREIQPIPNAGRTVDWEDKIPMDVISFVDPTDPNTDQLLIPTSDMSNTANTPHKRGYGPKKRRRMKNTDEIIDLS